MLIEIQGELTRLARTGGECRHTEGLHVLGPHSRNISFSDAEP